MKQYFCEECGKEIKNEYIVLRIEGQKLVYCNRECRNKFIEDSTEDENIHSNINILEHK